MFTETRRCGTCCASRLALTLILTTVLASCAPPNTSTGVVQRMYQALSKGDTDAYMDTLLPANRQVPNVLGIINALSLGIGPVGIDLSKLTQITVKNLELTVIWQDADYAVVQAEGRVRYLALSLELPFCDQHDTRLVDGIWYVDVYAPERETRLQRLLEERTATLESSGNLDPFDPTGYAVILETALDLCGSSTTFPTEP